MVFFSWVQMARGWIWGLFVIVETKGKRGEKDSGQAGGRKEIGFYLDELDFTFTANFSCQYLAC